MTRPHRNLTRLFPVILALLLAFPVSAQQEEQQEETKTFTDVHVWGHTSIKDQNRTGTCWCFSALSFLESELMRMDQGEYDLSEMFVVNKVYGDKARYYIRMHGHNNFGPGGLGHDVFNTIADHGIVREQDYSGLWEYEDGHNHSELHRVLNGIVDGVLGSRGPSPKWEPAYQAALSTYLGEIPEEITVNGGTLTPLEFRDRILELDVSPYVEITSFSHKPFYETTALLVPDNWVRYDETWNLPVDDVMEILENALNNGYTAVYGGDVSERSFDQSRGWADWRENEVVTQADRQETWNNWTTSDDHGMHIVGIARDEDGTTYYKVKNSWGETGAYDGYIYMSENFVRAKFDLITVHRDAIPQEIQNRMNLN